MLTALKKKQRGIVCKASSVHFLNWGGQRGVRCNTTDTLDIFFMCCPIEHRPWNGAARVRVVELCEGTGRWPQCLHARLLLTHPYQKKALEALWSLSSCRPAWGMNSPGHPAPDGGRGVQRNKEKVMRWKHGLKKGASTLLIIMLAHLRHCSCYP